MPHRGRLNLLTDILKYSPAGLFHKIKGGFEVPEDLGAECDVLSHLGKAKLSVSQHHIQHLQVSSPSLTYANASHPIKVSLLPNPSHLGK